MLVETVKTLRQIIHGTIYTDNFYLKITKKMAHNYLQTINYSIINYTSLFINYISL
jgi:hypothetical protein